MTNLDKCIKKQRHFPDKGPYSQSCGFSSSHVWMWELNYKEGWTPKNGHFWTVVLETAVLKNPLDSKEIKPVNPWGNQPWIFIGRTDAEEPTHWKRPWCWEGLRAREGDDRGWDGWMTSLIQSLSKLREKVKDKEAWRATAHGIIKSWTWLSDWTTTIYL